MKSYPVIFVVLGIQAVFGDTQSSNHPVDPSLTTATSIWTTSTASKEWQTPFGPNIWVNYITTETITQTSTRGQFPSYPATVVDVGTTTVTYVTEALADASPSYTYTSKNIRTYISSTTFIVYRPQATDMAVGKLIKDLPCEACAPADLKSDPYCDALGLDTACQNQCSQEDGYWWCRHMQFLELETSAQMGRVCWGNTTSYHQLMTPCIQGDHQFECFPCTGYPYKTGYNPTNWV